MRIMPLALAALLTTPPVLADAPRVVADVAPVHSLVAQVMEGVGEPALLIPAVTSPHGYALKPSQARLLSEADLVFWVGEPLTPWLARALDTLGEDAAQVELLEVDGLTLLHFEEEEDDDHEAEDHAHAHDHDGVDPHIWLDPENARILVVAIAEALAERDPENAQHYRENAALTADQLGRLTTETTEIMKTAQGRRAIVFHDGYRYFENRFGLGRAIAISNSEAARPGARRLSEIRDILRESDVHCVFDEVQFDPKAVTTILRGTDARRASLDPMGSRTDPGPALYAAMIRDHAATMAGCLK